MVSWQRHLYTYLFYFWLCWVFVAVCGLSLVVASGHYSSLQRAGFSLQWHLPRAPEHVGFSSCAQKGLGALRHLGLAGPPGAREHQGPTQRPCHSARALWEGAAGPTEAECAQECPAVPAASGHVRGHLPCAGHAGTRWLSPTGRRLPSPPWGPSTRQPTPVFLPGESPWMEEPGGLQSMGSLQVRHD